MIIGQYLIRQFILNYSGKRLLRHCIYGEKWSRDISYLLQALDNLNLVDGPQQRGEPSVHAENAVINQLQIDRVHARWRSDQRPHINGMKFRQELTAARFR